MKRYILLICLSVALLSTACRKTGADLCNPNSVQYSSPSAQFEAIWNGINNSYTFWDVDPTNWDSLYNVYLPKFQDLDGKDSIPLSTLREYYTGLCGNFIDHHMVVIVKNLRPMPSEKVKGIYVRPGAIEVQSRDYYHSKFSDSLIVKAVENLQASDPKIEKYFVSNSKGSILACNFDGIVYLHLSNFMLTGVLQATDSNSIAIAKVYKQFYDWAMALPELKGIILDQRNNGGGYVDDFNHVLAPFMGTDIQLGETRRKEGLGRYDYSVWIPFVIHPAKVSRNITVPIVAIADLNSVSMGELVTYAVTQLPTGYFIGERTYGATGPLISDWEFNFSGSFGDSQLSNVSHYVYTSTDVFRTKSGQIVEGKGFTPDYEVHYNSEKLQMGEDVQLNAALRYIRTGSAVQ